MAGDRRHIAVACTLLAALLACAEAASFTETIDSTWADRWTHSTAEKYNGKFVAEAPPGLPDELALKVRLLGGLDQSLKTAAPWLPHQQPCVRIRMPRSSRSTVRAFRGGLPGCLTPGSLASRKVPEKARHYGIATGIPETVDPAEGLVLQYDLKIADGMTCGGAYLKFLTADADIKFEELKDDSPYTVMFGPDKCGSTNKVRTLTLARSSRPLAGQQWP